MLLALVVAAETSASSPLDFVQYGILGLVLAALLMGWLWAKPAVDRLIADHDRVVTQRDALLATYEQKVIPALIESTQLTLSLKPVLEEVHEVTGLVRTWLVDQGRR